MACRSVLYCRIFEERGIIECLEDWKEIQVCLVLSLFPCFSLDFGGFLQLPNRYYLIERENPSFLGLPFHGFFLFLCAHSFFLNERLFFH